MANPFAGFVSLSSAGVSPAIGLDPTARVTQVCIDLAALNTSTGAGLSDVIIQATLDVFTSTFPGSATLVWTNISTSHYSSASYPSVGMQTIVSPIAGLRLSSTTYAGGLASVGLHVLQEIIG